MGTSESEDAHATATAMTSAIPGDDSLISPLPKSPADSAVLSRSSKNSPEEQMAESGSPSSKRTKRQHLDLRVDLSNAPKDSILSFMQPISEEEKARRRTAAFEEIRERAEELKARQEADARAEELKIRDGAAVRKRASRKR